MSTWIRWSLPVTMLLGGCASAPAPAADAPTRGAYCAVTVQNGTGYSLEVSYRSKSAQRSLGFMSPGEGIDVSVPCDDRYVQASGESQAVSTGRGRLRFFRSVELAVSEITKLTLRAVDAQR